MAPLTIKQKRMFLFLCEFVRKHGYQPSYEDIQIHLGYSSPGSVRNILIQLEKKSYIQRNGRSRSMLILKHLPTGNIPIVGSIAAGKPITALEEFGESLEDIQEIQYREGRIALRVKGDSMKDAGILDGDIAVIQAGVHVNNGEIAAVLIGDEATLKRVYFESDKVILFPENDAYSPIEIHSSDWDSSRIVGKYIALVRRS